MAASFAVSLLLAYLSDKLAHRFTFIFLPICVAIAGIAILMRVQHTPQTQYGALFLVAMGYTAMPVVICWFTMNLRGHTARAVGTAWQIGFGNIGGIIATFAFLAKDAPAYHTGFSLLLGFYCLAAVSATAYLAAVWWQNRTFETGSESKEGEGASRGDVDGEWRYLL